MSYDLLGWVAHIEVYPIGVCPKSASLNATESMENSHFVPSLDSLQLV